VSERRVWRNSRRDGAGTTRAFHSASSTLRVIWTRSANSHTGRRLSSCRIQGRTDDSIRPRATAIPTFSLAWSGASTDGFQQPPASRIMTLRPWRAKCAKTFRSVTRFTLCPFGDGLNSRRLRHGEGRHTSEGGKRGRRGLAPRPRDAAVPARVFERRDRRPVLPDLTMLNLEDLGMSQVEPRHRPLAAIAAPASDGPVVTSPMECVRHRAGELNE
jgi:hypothetical protein